MAQASQSQLDRLPLEVVTNAILPFVADLQALKEDAAELARVKASIPILGAKVGDILGHLPRSEWDVGAWEAPFRFLGRTPAGRTNSLGQPVPEGWYILQLLQCGPGCALNGGVRDALTGRSELAVGSPGWPITSYESGDAALDALDPENPRCCGHCLALPLRNCLGFVELSEGDDEEAEEGDDEEAEDH
jgi:hypothetical protein